MPPQVDFYVLSGAASHGRVEMACRLAEKAYRLGHRVYLLAADDAQARQLDELLWTFRQQSFVPHEIYPPETGDNVPVLIGIDPQPRWPAEVLINLAPEAPACFSDMQRVVELVDQQAAVLEASRARFRFYQGQGIEPATHKL